MESEPKVGKSVAGVPHGPTRVSVKSTPDAGADDGIINEGISEARVPFRDTIFGKPFTSDTEAVVRTQTASDPVSSANKCISTILPYSDGKRGRRMLNAGRPAGQAPRRLSGGLKYGTMVLAGIATSAERYEPHQRTEQGAERKAQKREQSDEPVRRSVTGR